MKGSLHNFELIVDLLDNVTSWRVPILHNILRNRLKCLYYKVVNRVLFAFCFHLLIIPIMKGNKYFDGYELVF